MTNFTALSRRNPWPYDARIGGVGVMLTPAPGGELVGRKSQPLKADPTEYKYGSETPLLGITYPIRDLVLGMGAMSEHPYSQQRYKYGIDVETSINGIWMKGPLFHKETIKAGEPIAGFVKALRSGTEMIHALAGRYVQYRQGDNDWRDSVDLAGLGLGSGVVANAARRFKHKGVDSADRLYVTTNAGNLVDYDGTTWYHYGTGEGPEDAIIRWVEVSGDELWFSYDNYVDKVEANPRVRDNYAGAITIGSAHTMVTSIRQAKNVLFIFKEDGVFTVSTAGLDQELYPGLRPNRRLDNGVGAAPWLDSLWVPFGDAFFKLDLDGSMRPIGMEQTLENLTEVRGRTIGFVGHNTWFGYELWYNEHDNATYLMKYGSWVETSDQRLVTLTEFRDVHHGALKKWAGKRGTCIDIFQFTNDNDRLYVGFDDGTTEWCYLPKNSPNPAADPRCEFTDQPSYVYIPDHYAGFQADPKLFRGHSVFGPRLSNNEYVKVEWRTDPNGSWLPLLDEDGAEVKFTSSGQRLDYPKGSNVVGRQIEIRYILLAENGGVPLNGTPIIEGTALHEAIRPHMVMEYDFKINARNHVVKRDGTTERRSAEQIKDAVKSAVSTPGNVVVVLPDGTEEEMSFYDFQEVLQLTSKRFGLEWECTAKAVQYRVITTPGTSGPLSYYTHATLEQYTHGELEKFL